MRFAQYAGVWNAQPDAAPIGNVVTFCQIANHRRVLDELGIDGTPNLGIESARGKADWRAARGGVHVEGGGLR